MLGEGNAPGVFAEVGWLAHANPVPDPHALW